MTKRNKQQCFCRSISTNFIPEASCASTANFDAVDKSSLRNLNPTYTSILSDAHHAPARSLKVAGIEPDGIFFFLIPLMRKYESSHANNLVRDCRIPTASPSPHALDEHNRLN